jgi:hypothetical protein
MKLLLCVLLTSSVAVSHTMWVRVHYSNEVEREYLINVYHDILTGNVAESYFEYFLNTEEVEALTHAGFAVDILHADIVSYLEETYGHLRMDFGYHYTYAEMVQELDDIVAAYPAITYKISLGQSWQGREIWALKVSDNASVNEDEPKVLITGIHHAREPISCGICMDFINWLVGNYGTNDTATAIVDHDEVWMVPVVNPDGYVFNETYEDPWGSGWRKNCRDNNNNGTMDPDYDGVDLNRNYGYQWGYDNQGSSADPADETYRGPSAFSEPELQVMREFCDTCEFAYALNYHSYGNYLIVPWGYINGETPDSLIYRIMADSMTSHIGVPNNYAWGTCYQTVGYPANGTSDDWLYGEQAEKPKCFAFTGEVGESFWQGATDSSEIVVHCNETRPMNIYLCMRALYINVDEIEQRTVTKLHVAPNPVSTHLCLNLQTSLLGFVKVALYDVAGCPVYTERFTTSSITGNRVLIDISMVPAGVYFLSISDQTGAIAQEKIVVLQR